MPLFMNHEVLTAKLLKEIYGGKLGTGAINPLGDERVNRVTLHIDNFTRIAV